MLVYVWKMRARKKRVADYEKFGRQVTLSALKKIEGCVDAHFVRTLQARKPEYLWLVFWTDQKALERARTNPVWRDQVKQFEAGNFSKSTPQELLCETVESFGAPQEKPQQPINAAKLENKRAPKKTGAAKSKPGKRSATEKPTTEGE